MLQLSDLFLFDSYSSIVSLELGRIRNFNLYPMDPLAQPNWFHSKIWESGFVIDFVMLISLMYCQPYPIPFFECKLDAGGTNTALCICSSPIMAISSLNLLWQSVLGGNRIKKALVQDPSENLIGTHVATLEWHMLSRKFGMPASELVRLQAKSVELLEL
jgi:hypothetical protein